jgi:hypothetical protein
MQKQFQKNLKIVLKARKIIGRIGQHLKVFLKPFALEKHQDASA